MRYEEPNMEIVECSGNIFTIDKSKEGTEGTGSLSLNSLEDELK